MDGYSDIFLKFMLLAAGRGGGALVLLGSEDNEDQDCGRSGGLDPEDSLWEEEAVLGHLEMSH